MSYRGSGGGGSGRGGGGRGRAGGRRGGGRGLGPSGTCKCMKCGKEVLHQPGMPCNQIICPICGIPMMRAAPNQSFSRNMPLPEQITSLNRYYSPDTKTNMQQINFPVIDLNKCTGCRECTKQCPSAAISIINNKAVIDLTRCRNCRTCQTVCPENAIQ